MMCRIEAVLVGIRSSTRSCCPESTMVGRPERFLASHGCEKWVVMVIAKA